MLFIFGCIPCFLISIILAAIWLISYFFACFNGKKPRFLRRPTLLPVADAPNPVGLRAKKPEWVRRAVLLLYEHCPQSHRKLAKTFNQLYAASTGISVGDTWVYELLRRHAHDALHLQQNLKHRIPPPLPVNRVWALDTSTVTDVQTIQNCVLGIMDCGSRLLLRLQHLRRFNTWTLLGWVFLAIGEFGKPKFIRLDNHPVHRSALFRQIMAWSGIRLWFTQPASPWQNGRIERLFGTLKTALAGWVVTDSRHLPALLAEFRFWYNTIRPHQHLQGRTPQQVWSGINPFQQPPKSIHFWVGWGGKLRGWVLRH